MAMIEINVPYLKEVVKQANMTGVDFGCAIGQGRAWFRNTTSRGKARDYAVDMVCRMFGADRTKLTTPVPREEKPKKTTPTIDDKTLEVLVNGLLRIEQKLDRLMARHGL